MNRPYLLNEIELNLKIHPICALLGPRQADKTTLSKMFANKNYPNDAYFFDLENPADLTRLENPLIAFSQVKEKLIVIDEIQLRPNLFSILRVIVDDINNNHLFLILGSASRELIKQSSESLAGRVGYIDVMPFSLEEVHDSNKLWLRGGFPKSYLAENIFESIKWRNNYVKTFLETDIPNLGFSIPPHQMRRFWIMISHYHGQILNLSELGKSMGLSHHTIKKYLDILVGTFMIRLLEPWYENISKRQVKTPKIYFRDSGILHTLLNINEEEQLYQNPKVGSSWEGFALEELIRYSHITDSECFFWGTHANAELDLFMLKNGKRIGFEFKYTDNPMITKSMQIALQDLKLNELFIIIPNNKFYKLTDKISVCGLDNLSNIMN